ncbi:hypothetical protein ACJX0J_008581 [Zea mays]
MALGYATLVPNMRLLKGACVPPGLFSLHISKVTHATFTHLCLGGKIFAQLYIYDTEHEVQNRLGMFVDVRTFQDIVGTMLAENANIPFGGKPIVYPDLLERYMDPTYLATRAISC